MFFFSNDDWLDLDTIYIKVKFGRICFSMRKSVNCYLFIFYFYFYFFCPPPFRRKAEGHCFWLSVVRGAWCVACGAWCVVRGAWCVARSAWCVVPIF